MNYRPAHARPELHLKHTRAVIDAIHDGALPKAKTERDPIFGFDVPAECPGVPRNGDAHRSGWRAGRTYRRRPAARPAHGISRCPASYTIRITRMRHDEVDVLRIDLEEPSTTNPVDVMTHLTTQFATPELTR